MTDVRFLTDVVRKSNRNARVKPKIYIHYTLYQCQVILAHVIFISQRNK